MIADSEVAISAIRAQGAGGQHVNKVASAIHLRFDIMASSLPQDHKERLIRLKDRRINSDSILIIKAQQFRSQEQNRADALQRLKELIQRTTVVKKRRRPTRVSLAAKRRRLESKLRHGQKKSLRKKVDE